MYILLRLFVNTQHKQSVWNEKGVSSVDVRLHSFPGTCAGETDMLYVETFAFVSLFEVCV